MSLKRPTPLEYAVVGLVNAAIAVYLGMRGSWTAAYFAVLAVGALWCAARGKLGDRSASEKP